MQLRSALKGKFMQFSWWCWQLPKGRLYIRLGSFYFIICHILNKTGITTQSQQESIRINFLHLHLSSQPDTVLVFSVKRIVLGHCCITGNRNIFRRVRVCILKMMWFTESPKPIFFTLFFFLILCCFCTAKLESCFFQIEQYLMILSLLWAYQEHLCLFAVVSISR